jgi:hypothetical protein
MSGDNGKGLIIADYVLAELAWLFEEDSGVAVAIPTNSLTLRITTFWRNVVFQPPHGRV